MRLATDAELFAEAIAGKFGPIEVVAIWEPDAAEIIKAIENPPAPPGKIQLLCCACLRAVEASPFQAIGAQLGFAKCVKCGGDLCGCPGCMDTLAKLRAGVLDSKALQLRVEITSWNETDGATINKTRK